MPKNDTNSSTICCDLLSFMTEKINHMPEADLLSSIEEFYSKGEIKEALKIFMASINKNKLKQSNHKYQKNKPLKMLYSLLKLIPTTDVPKFVFLDKTNIPMLKFYHSPIQLNIQDNLINDQKVMKLQISELTAAVNLLKDQVQILAKSKYGEAYNSDEDSSDCMEDDEFLGCGEPLSLQSVEKSASSGMRSSFIDSEATLKNKGNSATSCSPTVICIEDNSNSCLSKTAKSTSYIEENDNLTQIYVETEEINFDESHEILLEVGSQNPPFVVVENTAKEDLGKVYKCALCEFSTNDELAIPRHFCPKIYDEDAYKTSKSFRYFCLVCRFKSDSESHFRNHKLLHPECFNCPFCSEGFPESDLWKEHVLLCVVSSQKDSDKYLCNICGVLYATPAALAVHNGYHDLSKPFECFTCQYRFYTQDKLDRHIKTHNMEGFKCPLCPFINKNKTTLSIHLRCHTGVMPYSCKVCRYQCSSQSALTAHSLAHSDEKPLACDQCEATFKSIHKLNSHKLSHLQKKTHKCPECNKAFKTGWVMSIHHQRVHQNLRPHACEFCSYKARNLSALKSHLNTHSNEKTFKCTKCHFRANHKGYLRRHISTCHPDVSEEEKLIILNRKNLNSIDQSSNATP